MDLLEQERLKARVQNLELIVFVLGNAISARTVAGDNDWFESFMSQAYDNAVELGFEERPTVVLPEEVKAKVAK